MLCTLSLDQVQDNSYNIINKTFDGQMPGIARATSKLSPLICFCISMLRQR